MKQRIMTMLVMVLMLFTVFTTDVMAAKDHYDTWQDVARAMGEFFDDAIKNVDKDEWQTAHDDMNSAYFKLYETQGFEKNVMTAISAKRVGHIEGQFRDIKHSLLGHQDADKEALKEQIQQLKYKVFRDAMVLDGAASPDSEDDVGRAIDGTENVQADEGAAKLRSFLASFLLLFREGLEAILVVVAIITYLIKTGNKHLCRGVYMGVLAAVICSFVLAGVIKFIMGGVGASQELVEGLTMFLAVGVLFYVSNWMLHKSDEAAWKEYIQDQINTSIDKQSQRGLIFAAFIAVFREGAELVLFYQASFSGGKTDIGMAVLGFVVGVVVLAVIWILFRFTTVQLPLKPFFAFTSILLFVMCISFVGKGVFELTEAGLITGGTTIPIMNGFTFELLGIYDRAETLLPQLIILIAAVWIYVAHKKNTKRRIKAHEAALKKEAQA
ncbi:MAG: FTR1 family protein [Eubacteriales bacterium]|nr:FTR1 family protein [Eubacteriales bacterium]